jgi:predicted sulfurtransferase
MRNILSILMISALALLIACTSSAAPTDEKTDAKASALETQKDDHANHESEKDAPRISLEDAKKAFDSGEAIFIDTRSDASFKNEHVKGAINITSSDFEDKYKNVPKDKKIIVYCS